MCLKYQKTLMIYLDKQHWIYVLKMIVRNLGKLRWIYIILIIPKNKKKVMYEMFAASD